MFYILLYVLSTRISHVLIKCPIYSYRLRKYNICVRRSNSVPQGSDGALGRGRRCLVGERSISSASTSCWDVRGSGGCDPRPTWPGQQDSWGGWSSHSPTAPWRPTAVLAWPLRTHLAGQSAWPTSLSAPGRPVLEDGGAAGGDGRDVVGDMAGDSLRTCRQRTCFLKKTERICLCKP